MTLSAENILAVPLDQPERLFKQETVDAEYKALIKVWHPDINRHPKAAAVARHLNVLHQEASRRAKTGTWETKDVLSLVGKDGKTRRIHFRKSFEFELGRCYYGDEIVAWVVDAVHKPLFDHALRTLSTLHYANEDMKGAFAPLLPDIRATFETSDKCVLILNKPRGSYRMRDVMDALGGQFPAEGTAWVTSCLLNICCFLEWARISHGDISLDSCWVNPETHSVYLLGGWWYATEVGQELKFLPTRSYKLAPSDTLATKLADQRTDVLLAKAVGRELSGNPGRSPMQDFFRTPTGHTAVEDYSHWKDVILPHQFGASRFVELVVSESDVYKERK